MNDTQKLCNRDIFTNACLLTHQESRQNNEMVS